MNSNKTSSIDNMTTTLRDLDKFDALYDEHFSNDKGIKQGAKLTGRKRPDQSERMSGSNNPMADKEHPNKGKKIPKISEKLTGKEKTESHKANISKARKGVPIPKLQGRKRPEHSARMSGANNPHCRAITTPYGEFPSIGFVIRDHKSRDIKNAERKIRRWLSEPESGYYYTDTK